MDHLSREDKDTLVAQFAAIAGPQVQPQQAETFLQASEWNLENAIQTFFAAIEGEQQEGEGNDTEGLPVPATAPSSGPRTLDGRPVPAEASSTFGKPPASTRGGQTQRGVAGLRTLKDIRNSGPSHGQDDDDDDEDSHPEQDLFAGGEKSALAVQNPGQASDPQAAIRNMIKRAGRDQPRPGGEDSEQPRSRFTGTGQTLGGDDAPSRVVTQATPQEEASSAPPERRDLHIWRDGFSVDDGPLYRYDDPANRRYLDLINRGQAPTELLNVRPGTEVDVHLDLHRDEDYVKPKAKYRAFGGSGQRLGSPTPGASSAAQVPSNAPAAPAATAGGPDSSATAVTVDEAQPSVLLQIRLGDGTRLRSRFNTTHTIGDIYTFVNHSNPESARRGWALLTTFPSKELNDHSVVLGDIAELKKGGSVVQKWT